MQMDLPTLLTLIQQRAVSGSVQINSLRLTAGEWRPLAELELFRAFAPPTGNRPSPSLMPLPPKPPSPAANTAQLTPFEENLSRFFASLAIKQLQIDSLVATAAALLTAILGAIAHSSLVVPLAVTAGAGLGYLITDHTLFLRWIQDIRNSGFRRLPWQSRHFLIVAVVLPGYFLIAALLPRLPAERILCLIDALVGLLFGAAAGAVATFRWNALRLKKTFELTAERK